VGGGNGQEEMGTTAIWPPVIEEEKSAGLPAKGLTHRGRA